MHRLLCKYYHLEQDKSHNLNILGIIYLLNRHKFLRITKIIK